MLKLSKSILVLLSSAVTLGAASLTAHGADTKAVHVIKSAHAALFELGTKKVAATYVAKENICDVVISIANLPDADGYVSGAPIRISAPVAAGSVARVYVADGIGLEASCTLSANLLTVRPLALTVAAE